MGKPSPSGFSRNRDIMSRGKRPSTQVLPSFEGKKVEVNSITPAKHQPKDGKVWVAEVNINGWPHDIRIWASDEIGAFLQLTRLLSGDYNGIRAFSQNGETDGSGGQA